MARSVALSTIVQRARIAADMRNSPFISDTTALVMVNDVWPRLYDILVEADANYYATSTTFAITSGTQSYALPADFYKIIGVDFSQDGGSTWFTLFPYNEAERNTGFSPSAIPSGTVRLRYVPVPTTFTALTQSIDGIAGWDRMLSLLLAIDMLDAEESNTDRVYRKYREELERINSAAPNRDMGMPGTVTDIYSEAFNGNFNWLQYRLYGQYLEFRSSEYLTAVFSG